MGCETINWAMTFPPRPHGETIAADCSDMKGLTDIEWAVLASLLIGDPVCGRPRKWGDLYRMVMRRSAAISSRSGQSAVLSVLGMMEAATRVACIYLVAGISPPI